MSDTTKKAYESVSKFKDMAGEVVADWDGMSELAKIFWLRGVSEKALAVNVKWYLKYIDEGNEPMAAIWLDELRTGAKALELLVEDTNEV